MTTTAIKFPALPPGLTLTCDVLSLSSLAVLQAAIALTESAGIYSGNVTAAVSAQVLFLLKSSGTIIGYRIRTIADDVGPYVILTELEQLASDGRGPNIVTLTIDDGTDPLPGATVRITASGFRVTGTTNGSGVVVFALEDDTFDVVISKPGFGAEIDTLTVSGATTDTFSLTELVVTPPTSALLATGLMIVYDELGEIEADVPISIQLVSGPGTAGYALDTRPRSAVSDVDGLVEFIGLIRGATYAIWRAAAAGTETALVFATRSISTRQTFVVPNLDTFNLPEIIGADAE